MAIKARILVDGDRWAKRPYGVEFDDAECNSRFYANGYTNEDYCYSIIERAKEAGFDIDPDVERFIY